MCKLDIQVIQLDRNIIICITNTQIRSCTDNYKSRDAYIYAYCNPFVFLASKKTGKTITRNLHQIDTIRFRSFYFLLHSSYLKNQS